MRDGDRDPRWLEGAEPESAQLRELLQSAAQDEPDADRLAALRAGVLDGAAAGGGEGGAPTGGAPAGGAGAATKLAISGAVALSIGVATWFGLRDPAPEAPPEPAPAIRQEVAAPASEPPKAPPAATPGQPAQSATEVSDEAAKPSPKPAPKKPRRKRKKTTAESSDSLLAEMKLLDQAHLAIKGDPDRALKLAQQHRKRWPRGQMAQEREAIAIRALAKLGRQTEAKARAERFFRRYPKSGHRRSIEALLGD